MHVTRWTQIFVVAIAASSCTKHEPEAASHSPRSEVSAPPASPNRVPQIAAPPCAAGAHFAINGACKAGGRCVRVFEVTPTCIVREVNELDLSTAGASIADIVWPKLDGPLYAVVARGTDDSWAWGRIDKPRTATAAELATVKWTTEKLGVRNPGGFRFGVETDGRRVIFTSCSEWSESEEEWDCMKDRFRTIDKTPLDVLPTPMFATAWKPGEVAPGVTLRTRRDTLECRTQTGAWRDTQAPLPIAVAPIENDRWYLFHQGGGHRDAENIGVAAIAMKGCAVDESLRGDHALGPEGLWAYRVDRNITGKTMWKIHRRGSTTALTDASGAPFGVDADTFAWTHP